MANERITQKILEEARENASSIIAQAKETAALAQDTARAKIGADCDAILSKANSDAAEKQRRATVVAELDSRKKELAVKREILDIAYQKASEQFAGMDDAAYQDVYLKVTLPAIQKGTETIAPAKADEARLGKAFVDKLNAALGGKGGVTLAPAREDIEGGLVLSDQGMEINLSTASVMRSVREETEGEVAQMLFAAQEG